jgi:hypothetical protein
MSEPIASELSRTLLRRCLDRTHKCAKGDGHAVPASYLIGKLYGPIVRIKQGLSDGLSGKNLER